ncbi:hypothetical protein [Pseudoduganella sp. R-43]|uniref:hypothetical protein n=1 Tax=Pseudoduganella sp. R-43 TaxID=3404063 RepID=UPI003CFB9057
MSLSVNPAPIQDLQISNMTSQDSSITRFDVFVPGAFPQYSYVKRVFSHPRTKVIFDPEVQIGNVLKQPGMIAQIVGPSKSGKTRAVENCVGLANLVLVAGSQIGEQSSLWDVVVRTLKSATSEEIERTQGSVVGGEVKASGGLNVPMLAKAETEFSASTERSNEVTEKSTYENDPFQLATSQLQAQKKVLFLDDFHTIPESMQATVAAQLKAAAQVGVKICLAEVPHHSDSTISALPDLTARVSKIEFQYWSNSDLIAIGSEGFASLGATVSAATLNALALESAGSPQLMQLICLNVAEFLQLDLKLKSPESFQLDISQIRHVLVTAHAAIDRDKIFRILDTGPDERGSPRNRYPMVALDEGDNYEITLAAISLSPPTAHLTWGSGMDNLYDRIDRVCKDPNKKPAKGQITRALEQMQSLAEKHMPRQPIIEWSDSTGLHILDPYFLFYLRWSEKYESVRAQLPSPADLFSARK